MRIYYYLALAFSAWAQPPAITPRGVVNSASKMPQSLAGGSLAPGAKILIPGKRMTEPTVRLDHNDWHTTVKPISASDTKLEVQLPPDTPLGTMGISVVNGEGASRPEQVTVVSSNPGIYTLNGDGWGPVMQDTVRPGSKIKIRTNGLNDKHAKVFVGGMPAKVVGIRGQEITLVVPRGAAAGCWTPLWIESAPGRLSNFATISIGDPHSDCEQLNGWPARAAQPQTRVGLMTLERIRGSIDFPVGKTTAFSLDAAAAVFFRAEHTELSPMQALPSAGTCTAYTGIFSLTGAPSGDTLAQLSPIRALLAGRGSPLDAGPSLTVDGASQAVLRGVHGEYSGLLGGSLPIIGRRGNPLFLTPGAYHIRADGSEEIAKLDISLDVPPEFEWVNRSTLSEIDRSQGVQVDWKGLSSDRQMVLVALSLDTSTTAMGTCLCVASANATGMRIPPYALANLPPTVPPSFLPIRFLIVASVPSTAGSTAAPKGLDEVRVVFLDIQGKNVVFR